MKKRSEDRFFALFLEIILIGNYIADYCGNFAV